MMKTPLHRQLLKSKSHHHHHQNQISLKLTTHLHTPIDSFFKTMKLLHLITTISPLFLTLIFSLSSSTPSPSQPSLLSLQLISLLSLKSSLKDPLLSLHDWEVSNPKFEDPVWCSWSGIKCDPKTAQIISLDLSHKNLSGELSIIKFKYLSSLIHLNLSSNSFDCPFPNTIFELTQLRTLDLSHNNFNSTFPPGVSKINFLKIFNAYSNGFTGPLPEEFVKLQYLEQLNLGGSYFEGSIPASYGGFTRLKFLHLAGNLLEGPLPGNLGYITKLEHLEIGYNKYYGGIPAEFSYLSNLSYMDISQANLSGDLTPEIGNLTALQTLFLFKNQFTGEIPVSFSNMRSIKSLDLSDNQLSGNIPAIFAEMKELNMLSLMNNNLTGEIPESIGDLVNLEILSLWNNSLSGNLPQKLGSNGRLKKMDVSSNFLSGPIPQNLCIGNRLEKLILFSNKFIGNLPNSLTNCSSLIRLRVQDNYINGSIPEGLGLLQNLTFVDLSNNKLAGNIPADLGYALNLQYLNISENLFESSLPDSIWSGPSLQVFIASSCKIVGKIPDFVGCKNVYRIELDGNLLNGSIPWNIDHCFKLLRLNLRQNLLDGIIPWEISTLPSITDVDLSHNFLSGTIPSNFNNCTTLESFNVSYNLLTGSIPSNGAVFSNLHSSSFTGNVGLCGGIIDKQCAPATPGGGNSLAFESSEDHRMERPKKTVGAIVWITAGAFGIGLLVLIAGTRCFRANYNHRFGRDPNGHRETGSWKLTAFQRLNFTANDVLECLSMSDKILGMGSAGTVYKAEMPSGEIIAVKRLLGKNKETVRRRRGVLAEVEVLGNVRHRNIVRLLGCCSNRETTMLLYEYMPNGSLEELLHGKNNLIADWFTRYKIALGVAQGICYLHHDCDPVIVHRDLNPSNILIDGEMEARVADFGVAKLIMCDESMSVIAGSYGYIAPEYAYTLQVDEKSDIYSYGVVLLEILTGKRSVNAEFGDGNSIVDWVRSKMKTKDGIVIRDILDKNAGASCVSVREEMMLLLRVALLCTSRNPADRPSMRDVVSMLQEAKPQRKLSQSGGGGGGNVAAEKPSKECDN